MGSGLTSIEARPRLCVKKRSVNPLKPTCVPSTLFRLYPLKVAGRVIVHRLP